MDQANEQSPMEFVGIIEADIAPFAGDAMKQTRLPINEPCPVERERATTSLYLEAL